MSSLPPPSVPPEAESTFNSLQEQKRTSAESVPQRIPKHLLFKRAKERVRREMIRQRATSDLEDSETRHKERVASDLGNAEANVDKSSTNEMVDADIETEMKQTGEKALVDIEIGNYRTDEKAQSAKKTPTKGNVPSTLAKGSQQCKEEIEVQVGDARQKLPPGLSKRLALAGLQTMAELKAELKAELEAELKAEVMAELEDKVVAAVVTKLEPQHKITEEHMGKASRFMEKNRERSAKE